MGCPAKHGKSNINYSHSGENLSIQDEAVIRKKTKIKLHIYATKFFLTIFNMYDVFLMTYRALNQSDMLADAMNPWKFLFNTAIAQVNGIQATNVTLNYVLALSHMLTLKSEPAYKVITSDMSKYFS